MSTTAVTPENGNVRTSEFESKKMLTRLATTKTTKYVVPAEVHADDKGSLENLCAVSHQCEHRTHHRGRARRTTS